MKFGTNVSNSQLGDYVRRLTMSPVNPHGSTEVHGVQIFGELSVEIEATVMPGEKPHGVIRFFSAGESSNLFESSLAARTDRGWAQRSPGPQPTQPNWIQTNLALRGEPNLLAWLNHVRREWGLRPKGEGGLWMGAPSGYWSPMAGLPWTLLNSAHFVF